MRIGQLSMILTSALLSTAPLPAQTGRPEPPLINSHIRTLVGRRADARCEFTLVLAPGQTAIQANAKSGVTVNADGTCQAYFEVGEPLLMDSVHDPTPSPEDGPVGSTLSAGYLRSWFVDPVGIVVNEVVTATRWWWLAPGTCVDQQSSSYHRDWFEHSGWSLVSESWMAEASCVAASSQAVVTFFNAEFPLCPREPVYAFYAPTAVWGTWDGQLLGQFAWDLTGPTCIRLLTPQFRLVRTLN